MADLRALSRFSTSSGLSIDPRLVLDTDRVAAGGMVQSTAATPLSFQTTGANSDITLSATRHITLNATTGYITLAAVDNSSITVSANSALAKTFSITVTNVGGGTGDISISAANGTFTVVSSGTATLDFKSKTYIGLNATGSINIGNNVTPTNLNVYSAAATISANLTSALQLVSNNAAAQTLTITCSNAGVGAGNLTMSCKTMLDIDCTDCALDATGAFSFDSALNSNVTIGANSVVAQTLLLSCTNLGAGTGNLTVSCEDTLSILATGGAGTTLIINSVSGLNIDCAQCDLDATGALSIDAATTSNITLGANNAAAQTLTISCTNAGAGAGNLTVSCEDTLTIVSTAPGTIDMDCRQFTLDTTQDISLDTVGSSNFTVAANGAGAVTLTVNCTNAGAGAGNLTLACKSTMDVDCTTYTLDATGGISLDAAVTSNITVAGNAVGAITFTLSCTNATGPGNIDLSCKSTLNIDCTDCTLDATAAISLTAATASSFTVSGAVADLTFNARAGTPITLNQAGSTALVGFTATSIIGALNELKLTGGSAAFISTTIPAGASTTDSFASVRDGVAEWLYIIRFNGNIRGGTIKASWDQSVPDAKLYETVTTDMGVTTDITFTVSHSGANMSLNAANAGVNVYDFRAVRRVVSF